MISFKLFDLLSINALKLAYFERNQKAEFSHELINSARTYLDKQAIYHQDFAGNCIEESDEKCVTDGIGPERFDCSGLVIRVIYDTLGTNSIEHPESPRHVRDMWLAANEQGQSGFYIAEFSVGALVVIRRKYTINGEHAAIAGHVGIVTKIKSGLDIIHANPRTGKVEESSVRNWKAVMGFIAVNPSDIH